MDTVDIYIRAYGYPALFGGMLLQQLLPFIPGEPFLLAAGALAGAGHFNFWIALALGVSASVVGDHAWFEVGRRGGPRILRWMCRLSIEPDTCVRNRQDTFARRGANAFVVGKVVPGFNGIGQPLAGVFGMPRWRFLALDAVGTAIWVGLYFGLGFVFREQLAGVAALAHRLGGWAIVILVVVFSLYLGIKITVRQMFIRQLRVARIDPADLAAKLTAGDPVFVADLRHDLDIQVQPTKILGAVRIAPAALESGSAEVPRDREVVLYCT